MEENLEVTATRSQTPYDRAPLGVRVIAGFLTIAGVCVCIHHLLDVATGRELPLPIGLVLMWVAWGLMQRREWARGCAVILLFIPLTAGGIMLFAVLFVDGNLLQLKPDPGNIGPIGRKLYALGMLLLLWTPLYLAFKAIQGPTVQQWFGERLNSWCRRRDDRRWRFGTGALFFLTIVVACGTLTALMHPGIQSLQAEQWAEAQDLNDPVYFPHGANPLPSPEMISGTSRSNRDGSGCDLQYATAKLGSLSPGPQLVYVAMDRWRNEQGRLQAGIVGSEWSRGQKSLFFGGADRQKFTFPRSVQILERNRGKIHTSDMRITLLEFWSFHEHPDAVWTLEGLETYVKDLRQRVAERDAAKALTAP